VQQHKKKRGRPPKKNRGRPPKKNRGRPPKKSKGSLKLPVAAIKAKKKAKSKKVWQISLIYIAIEVRNRVRGIR
jgi:hypothetical protein